MALVLSIVLLTNFWVPESDFEDSLDLPTTSYLQLGASGGEDERGQLVADLADLAGWLVGLFVGWLVGCLAGLLAVCVVWLAGSLAVRPACCLAGLLSKFGIQFWGRFLAPVFGTTFGIDFWVQFLVPNLAPFLVPILEPIFGTSFGTFRAKISVSGYQFLVPNLAPFLGPELVPLYIFNRGPILVTISGSQKWVQIWYPKMVQKRDIFLIWGSFVGPIFGTQK